MQPSRLHSWTSKANTLSPFLAAGAAGGDLLLPKGQTPPGCTKEACGFRDQWARYRTAWDQVCWGSAKDRRRQPRKKFIAKYTLPVHTCSVTRALPVASAYGSYGTEKFHGREYMGMIAPHLRGGPRKEA